MEGEWRGGKRSSDQKKKKLEGWEDMEIEKVGGWVNSGVTEEEGLDGRYDSEVKP